MHVDQAPHPIPNPFSTLVARSIPLSYVAEIRVACQGSTGVMRVGLAGEARQGFSSPERDSVKPQPPYQQQQSTCRTILDGLAGVRPWAAQVLCCMEVLPKAYQPQQESGLGPRVKASLQCRTGATQVQGMQCQSGKQSYGQASKRCPTDEPQRVKRLAHERSINVHRLLGPNSLQRLDQPVHRHDDDWQALPAHGSTPLSLPHRLAGARVRDTRVGRSMKHTGIAKCGPSAGGLVDLWKKRTVGWQVLARERSRDAPAATTGRWSCK